MKTTEITEKLNLTLSGFYGVTPNSDGTFTVETVYNLSIISFSARGIDWIKVTKR